MNIVTKRTILFYIDTYPFAANSLRIWYDELSKASFENFNEMKSIYGNASVIANKRVIFNIKGNTFRLIVSINFDTQNLYIIWFGTHEAYNKVDAATVKHLKNPSKQ